LQKRKHLYHRLKFYHLKKKGEWDLQAKYNIGKKVEDESTEV